MEYIAGCGLATFVIGFTCSVFVLGHKPRTEQKILLALFSFSSSFWGLSIFYLFTTTDYQTALFWGRAANIVALFIPIAFFHFVLLLTERLNNYKSFLKGAYCLIAAYLITALLFSDYYIADVRPVMGFRFYPLAGKLYYLMPIIFSLIVLIGYVNLFKGLQIAHGSKRNQLKYFLIASLIGFIGGGCTFFLVFDVPVYPALIILVPTYNLLLTYIILKHRLIDIRLVVHKGLIYAFLIGVISISYLLVIFLLENFFRNVFGYQSLIISATAMIVIGLLFIPIKNYITTFVDKYFFKGTFHQIVQENDNLRYQVLQAERYKSQVHLTKGILDQLRDPLTTLIIYNKELPKHIGDAQFINKFALVLDKEVNRINSLVMRLAEFSQPKEIHAKPANIIDIVNDIIVFVQPHLSAKGIILYRIYEQQKPLMLNLDAQQIRQAVYHVLMASIDTVAKDGQIWIGIEEQKDMADISIKDTGRGFSIEEKTRIFDPFKVDSKEGDERDFGLSIAQSIVRNHGGNIVVESEIAVGTEWIIQIPGVLRGI